MTSIPPTLFSLRRLLRALSAVLLTLFMSLPIPAQTAGIDWPISVRDEEGRAVVGAIVTLVNEQTKEQQTQKTDDSGAAFFRQLAPGTYRVTIEGQGFKSEVREHFIISARTAGLDVELTSLQQRVFSAPEGGPTTAQVTTVTPEDLAALPNLNNDLKPILEVVPGAVPAGPAALGRVLIDGKGRDQQIVRVDGLDVTPLVDLPGGDSSIGILDGFLKPSVALGTTIPKSGAFDARFGPSTGAVVSGDTLSGVVSGGLKDPLKKRLKAQLYDRLLNDGLNARNFFDYDGKNALRRNVYGGKVGGLLVPQRAYFFVAYEGIRGRTEQNLYEAVPADALCNCGALAPLMGQFLPSGTTVVQGASLNPTFLVARRRVRLRSESDAFDGRFDWTPFAGATNPSGTVPKAADIITFRVTHQMSDTLLPDGVTGRGQRQRLDLTHVLASAHFLTEKYIHDFRFGINRTRARADVQVSPATAADLSRSLVAVSGAVNAQGLPGGLSSVPVATLGGLIKGVGRGFDLNPASYNVSYDFSPGPGTHNHEFRFGVEARFIRLSLDRLGGLTYTFPNSAALRTGTPSGVSYLSDLNGASPFSDGSGPRHARQQYYMGYVQGISKFFSGPAKLPRVMLSYGLRYDYFGPVRERDDRAVVVDPQTGQFMAPGTAFYRASRVNFQPRAGLEFRPSTTKGLFANTAFNVGAGVYSGAPRIGDLLMPIESDRFATGVTGGTFPMSPDDVTRGFVTNPETRQFQPLAFARDFSTPERVYKWDAKYTRRFAGVYDFSVGYSGNVGRNLPLAGVANQIVSVTTNPEPTKTAIVVRQFDLVRGGQVFKPFGEFFYRTSGGRSSFNAMTVAFSRSRDDATDESQVKHKWLLPNKFITQYTLSRSVGNVSGAVASDPTSFLPDYGYNASDARHSFSLQLIYPGNLIQPDTGSAGFDKFLRGVLHGTTFAPTISARSGTPINVRLDRPDVVYLDSAGNVYSQPDVGRRAVINTPGGGASGGSRVPSLLGGANPYLRNGLELLNPAAFAIPAPGTFGNLKRGALRGPASFKVDLAVTRRVLDLNETKGITVDFKAEFLNLFNRANFSNPPASLPNVLGTSVADNQLQPSVPFSRKAAGAFGIFNAADIGRQIQFSLTFNFGGGF